MLRGVLRQKYQATKLEFVTPTNLHITSYDASGFNLSNGCNHIGPIALYQGMVLKWKADNFNINNLALWQSLRPTMLLFGTGNDPLFLPTEIRSGLTKFKIPFEAMATKHAVSTYAVLCNENRKTALLCLPCAK